MAFLCVTQALARSAGLSKDLPRITGRESIAGAVLGVWYLDVVHSRAMKLVLAVDVGTRWAFALPAAPFATLAERFGQGLFGALLAVGVPPDRARAEVDAGAPYGWARLTDRSVQSHLRQCKEDAAWAMADGASIAMLNARLSRRPILAPRKIWPADEVLRQLGGDPELPSRLAREEGRQWREAYDAIQAQAGQASLRLPVALLLHTDRLEARHQARMLFSHVPGSPLRSALRLDETPPCELVLDLQGIHDVASAFCDELATLVEAHPLLRLRLEAIEPEVARVFAP